MERTVISFPGSAQETRARREGILCALMRMDEGFACTPVKSIRSATLAEMLRLYDQVFLSGFLSRAYLYLEVTLSPRLLSAAGKFVYSKSAAKRREHAEIRMSGDFLFRLEAGDYTLNGLCAHSPQEAFLIVFEHELCHALEAALYGSTGHGERFMMLAGRLFGHTQSKHALPTRRLEAAQQGLTVGMRASFPFQGRVLSGTVTYIGKTATVMVPDAAGQYRDRSARRYTKYRVPPSQIKQK